MNFILSISTLILLLAALWSIVLVRRARDWRLVFLPLMMALMALQSILPPSAEIQPLMRQVSILTVVGAMFLSFFVRRDVQRLGGASLRLMLGVIIFYGGINLLAGSAFSVAVLLHSELLLSLVIFLSIVIFGHMLVERKLAEESALQDPLTGLPNRILFMEKLRRAHARTNRRGDYLFAVLFLDLDRFKHLNDRLGHAVGDRFLTETARRLRATLRPEDTVARLGGDEFAVLVDNLADRAEAERLARRLKQELEEPCTLNGQVVFTSTSIGIAFSATGYQRAEDLLSDADTAMYRAKATQKGYYEIFNINRHIRAMSHLQLEASLERAVEDQQFRVRYQPVVALDSGKITGCEALLRWNHPDRGLLSPAEFIPAVAGTGLILPIGEWILRAACAQNRRWQLAGLPPIIVSVNVAPHQLRQRGFAETVSKALGDTGLNPHFLELELTENALIENPEAVSRTIDELAVLGVGIAIDDFGTGYSSLSSLCRFPFHTLKIDRSFVNAAGKGDVRSVETITALIMLARTLKLNVTAEGVESQDELTFLRALQCYQGQGFFFSPPLVPRKFTQFLERRQSLRIRGETDQSGEQPMIQAPGKHQLVTQKSSRQFFDIGDHPTRKEVVASG